MTNYILILLCIGVVLSSIFVITSKNPVISVIFLILLFMNMAIYLIWSNIGFIGLSYILIYIGAITVLFLFIIMMINIRLVDILETGYQYTKNIPLAVFLGVLFIYLFYSILPYTNTNWDIVYIPFDVIQNLSKPTFIGQNYFIFNIISIPVYSVSEDIFFNLPAVGHGTVQGGSENEIIFNLINNSKLFKLSAADLSNYILDSAIENFEQIQTLAQGLYTYGAIWLIISSIILLLAMISAIILSSNKRIK